MEALVRKEIDRIDFGMVVDEVRYRVRLTELMASNGREVRKAVTRETAYGDVQANTWRQR